MTETQTPPEPEISPADREKFAAWLQHARTVYGQTRMIGYFACVAGIVTMVWSRFGGGPGWALWAGVGLIVLGWAIFAYVVWARYQWVKKHPFDPAA